MSDAAMTRPLRVAAVDLGATSGRVMVGTVGQGRLGLEEVHRFANGPVKAEGTLYWDVLGIYRETLVGLRQAAAGGPVDAIGIDSWAVDYGLLGASGALLGNPVSHRDPRTDGMVERIAVGTSRPVRDPQAIRALFVERLVALGDEVDPGFGFDLARLSVLVAEPCPHRQIGLGTREDQEELDRLVDRLSARLGRRRIARLVAHDGHMPELAAAAAPAQTTTHAAAGWDAFRRFRTEAGLSPRPLRLLARPESIEDVFALVPDGPPVRFRWRRALHVVVAAEGPERIESAWWTEAGGPARDYFRVEDEAGLRFWLFRAGLYRDMALSAPRWFMHGMYA